MEIQYSFSPWQGGRLVNCFIYYILEKTLLLKIKLKSNIDKLKKLLFIKFYNFEIPIVYIG